MKRDWRCLGIVVLLTWISMGELRLEPGTINPSTSWIGSLVAAQPAVSKTSNTDRTARSPGTDLASIRVRMSDGCIITGVPEGGSLALMTSFGRMSLPLKEVRGLETGSPLSHYLVRGEVESQYTEFVEELPEELALRFQRITRVADTIGPQDGRHDTAPWLYPIAGQGELPRIIVEEDTIYFPIRSTWRSVWSGVVHYYDENRRLIMPAEHSSGPHTATSVDYYVASVDTLRDPDMTADDAPTNEVCIHLNEGSIIRGRLTDEALRVSTTWGKLSIPATALQAAVFEKREAGGETWYEVKIDARGNNHVRGVVDFTELSLDSALGRLTIPVARITRVTAVAADPEKP